MARFDIISKSDPEVKRYSGKPRYNGSYLKPSYLEFNEISSATPIAWEIGDYVDYPRTGMRYRLYSIPQASKKARKELHGGAFTYSNVQLYAATKELEIAPFRDLVPNDNGIHFSTSPDVATFEDVYGIARRIQACMDDLYPGRWEIRVASLGAGSEVDLTEAKEFALSGGTCLDALSKIYELWQDIGWIHSYEAGKEVVTIGYANNRIGENATDAYLFGKGKGLVAIKKNQTNKDEFATRLYVYGSERNLPSRYYNGLGILNAESVDIRNLMLPLDRWGQTDGLPDARKAYLENPDAVAKYGVIPKTHYFDSPDAGAYIYPSIEGMTIGQIRKIGSAEYIPSASVYPYDSERVDEVSSVLNPNDDGALDTAGKSFDYSDKFISESGSSDPVTIKAGKTGEVVIANLHEIVSKTLNPSTAMRATLTLDPGGKDISVRDAGFESVTVEMILAESFDAAIDGSSVGAYKKKIIYATKGEDGAWHAELSPISADYDQFEVYTAFDVHLYINVTAEIKSIEADTSIFIVESESNMKIQLRRILYKEFYLIIKQIGFDINERAALGEGKVVSMKTGKCAGRSFVITDCIYQEANDSWIVYCRRQQDDTLSMLFPNADYPIASGDRFILTDILMPELYIRAAMERLLAKGEEMLARVSKIQSHYEPSIDAKAMIESGRTLREGMFMEISDEDVIDNGTDYILIDTLSIYEDESAIPTYKVTLRERRKVTYKGTPSATSSTSTRSAEDTSDSKIDLAGYATEQYVDKKLRKIESLFYFADDNTIGTKYKFFSEQQVSAGGIGEEVEGEGEGSGLLLTSWPTDGGDYSSYALAGSLGIELHRRLTAVEKGGVIPDLTGYATEFWVSQQLSSYAIKSDLEALSKEFDDFLSGSDTDTIINKWKELETFLGGLSESDNLAEILSTKADSEELDAVDEKVDSVSDRVAEIENGDYATKSYVDSENKRQPYFRVLGSAGDVDIPTGGGTSGGGSTTGGSPVGAVRLRVVSDVLYVESKTDLTGATVKFARALKKNRKSFMTNGGYVASHAWRVYAGSSEDARTPIRPITGVFSLEDHPYGRREEWFDATYPYRYRVVVGTTTGDRYMDATTLLEAFSRKVSNLYRIHTGHGGSKSAKVKMAVIINGIFLPFRFTLQQSGSGLQTYAISPL